MKRRPAPASADPDICDVRALALKQRGDSDFERSRFGGRSRKLTEILPSESGSVATGVSREGGVLIRHIPVLRLYVADMWRIGTPDVKPAVASSRKDPDREDRPEDKGPASSLGRKHSTRRRGGLTARAWSSGLLMVVPERFRGSEERRGRVRQEMYELALRKGAPAGSTKQPSTIESALLHAVS